MSDIEDAFAIQQLVARFANSFDEKDWKGLAGCLAPSIHTDYTSLRGTPPETMTRDRFVESRRAALEELSTHHLSGNVEVKVSGLVGEAKVSMMIYRRNEIAQTFDTHCLYQLGVERSEEGWVIRSIVQTVFWNDGRKEIHQPPDFGRGPARRNPS